MRERIRYSLLAAAVLIAALLAAPGVANAQAPATCPATFEVLHDDTVGALYLPKGNYTVTLLDSAALSCAEASDLFRQFLEDFDGRLRRPWVVDARDATFTRGAGGSVGFKVAPATGGGGGGGGGHHPVGTICPGTFQVVHDDHIGTFVVPSGQYLITLLSVGRITCSKAAAYLARFLDDFDGVLPTPWLLDPETGSFMRGARNVGFRIKELAGPPVPHGGGSGTYPSGKRCPDTFRVLNNDSIGQLRLRKGSYRITLVNRGLSCQRAAQLFRSFLQDFQGTLPSPWRLAVQTATFTRGAGRSAGFRVKPIR
jgi:uncharacterized spore protein YtfJ